jgi:hypothetical protein
MAANVPSAGTPDLQTDAGLRSSIPHTESRALLVTAIGEKYRRLLRYKYKEIHAYAQKCNARLIVQDKPLDPTNRRSLFSQRLLIPTSYPEYDIIALFDMDIHISRSTPDIFETMDCASGLAAVLDQRGSESFRRTWRDFPRILSETSESYFSSRGFPVVQDIQGSVNGGILLFRPHVIGSLFSDYYWSDHTQNSVGDGNEEAPLAYISQTNDIFQALDDRYNRQFIYSWNVDYYGNMFDRICNTICSSVSYRGVMKLTGIDIMRCVKSMMYSKFIRSNMSDAYIVHMSGGYETRFRVRF